MDSRDSGPDGDSATHDRGLPASRHLMGRCAVLLAGTLQAGGQVGYGTWLRAVPSPLFVFIAIALGSTFFLLVSRRGAPALDWKPLLLLNAATALAFLSFFYALKLIEPAIASAVHVGIGPLIVVGISLLMTGVRPTRLRLLTCLGILTGCAVLAVAAARGTSGGTLDNGSALLGLAASACTGVGAVLITVASKALLDRGWTSGAVVAHRFYLVLPLSLALALASGPQHVEWSPGLVITIVAVAALGVVAPLYLLQVGIRQSDPHAVLVMMAAMPLVTFAMQGFSPVYAWTWLTGAGLTIITAFILLDIAVAGWRRGGRTPKARRP